MRTHLLKLFTEDDRAVAPIIGFILLFGILTIAFAGYQAEQVPQQNAETEFQHYQDVQNDLIVVRNAISRAGQQNQSQFESVRLGTNYRKRTLALNPPDPTGTLRTSDSHSITIEEGEIEGGRTPVAASPIPTRFLTYQNGYNELEVAPIQYDNSVLYLSDPDGDEAVVFEEQNLVRNNGDVVLTALQNPFDRSATGRVTIELYPTASAPATPPDGTLTITIPTKLSADYWTDALAQTTLDEANYNVLDATEAYPGAPEVRGLELQVTADDLVFNTVGIGSAPEGSDSPTTGIGNPPPPPPPNNFDVTIDSTNSPVTSGDSVTVDATIENTGGQSTTQTIELDIEGQSNPVATQDVTLASDESTTVTLNWQTDNNDHNQSPYTATVSSNNDSDTTEIVVQNPGQGNGGRGRG